MRLPRRGLQPVLYPLARQVSSAFYNQIRMTVKAFALTFVAVLILVIVILRYRAGMSRLHVEPHAAEEIEKAKQR